MAIMPEKYKHSGCINDSPTKAQLAEFKLAEGDFVVLATDGLWDNLTYSDLLVKISEIKASNL